MAVVPEAASKLEGSMMGVTSLTLMNFAPTGADRFAIIGIALFDETNTVSGITRTGDTPVFIGRSTGSAGNDRVEFWKILAPVTGAADVVISLTASDDVAAFIINYNGVNQSTPHDTPEFTQQADAVPSLDEASAVDDYVVDVLASTEGGHAVGGGQTQRMNQQPADLEGYGSDETGATTVTMSWTVSAEHAHGVINLNAAGAARRRFPQKGWNLQY